MPPDTLYKFNNMTRQLFFITLLLYWGHNVKAQFNYPPTKTVDSSDTWHNITVKNPYRWLENLESEETKNWFKAQNDYTNGILDKLPMADELYKDLLQFDSIKTDNITSIQQVSNTLFYFNQKPGDAKQKLFKRNGEYGKEDLVTDHTRWGSNYNISWFSADPYQKYLVISAGEGGKEISEAVKFYDITTGAFLNDSLPGMFVGFAPGEGNMFYLKRPTLDVHTMVQDKDCIYKIHKLGTDTLQDKVFLSYTLNPELYAPDNSKHLWPAWFDKDCNYEMLGLSSVSPYKEYYYRKINSGAPWKKLIDADDEIAQINILGNKMYMACKKNAPNGKILMMDLDHPVSVANAKLIAAEKNIPLQCFDGLAQTKNYLILPYMKNGVQLFNYTVDMRTGKFSKIPFLENTNLMNITPFNQSNDDVLIERSGWVTPITLSYSSIDKPFAKEKTFSFHTNPKYPYTGEMVVEEVEIASHDGIMVPVSIIHKKGIQLNGENTGYVYGYGAYGISSASVFGANYQLLAHKGIVIAIAHVRGGGEKGENWHMAGYKQTKPNTWKDLNSTAEYLISKGYTSAKHLVCMGTSAGGIFVGRAVTERPDLWACAVPQVGCLNMVRQEFSPNGPINIPEFGTVKDINEFFALMEMDATLHVQPGTKYPAMLITTGWNDPLVISWQPAKFAAAVQNATTSGKPVLLQVDYNAGHGDSEDKFAGFKKWARKWAFILEQTGYKK